MEAIVVTEQAVGKTGMKLAARPAPHAAINDVSFRFTRRDSPGMN